MPQSTPNPLHNPAPPPGSSGGDPQPIRVRDFQQHIRDRYFATDNARGTAGTFLYLTEEFGELATALAANNRAKTPPTDAERANLLEEFADVLAWLATLANINNVDLEEALTKYTENTIEGVKE